MDWRKYKNTPYLIISVAVIVIYIYLLTWLIEAWSYFLNPDGYSYLTIALKFQSLNPQQMLLGVNGLWSPLLPLISTFFLSKFHYIVALKYAVGFTSILLLLVLIKFMHIFRIKPIYIGMLVLVSITSMLALTLTIVSPDQLAAAFLLLYTYFLLNKFNSNPIICSVLGFLAYLSKQYSYYFFILHFTLVNGYLLIYSWRSLKKKIIIKNYIIGMITFVILSMFWVGLLTQKYKSLTLESSTKINVFLLLKSKHQDALLTNYGLFPPSNETAVNAWEDPTLIARDIGGDFLPIKKSLSFLYKIL